MKVTLNVSMTDSEINIELQDSETTIKILNFDNYTFDKHTLCFFLSQNNLKCISTLQKNALNKDSSFDKLIAITAPSDINIDYLEYLFINECIEKGNAIISKNISSNFNIPDDQKSNITQFKDIIVFILKNFGYDLFKSEEINKSTNNNSTGKVRHKWTKEISKMIFTAKSKNGEGQAIWESKDKLVLLAGAKLVADPQMNKNGTVNYSAQFAQKLRSDNSNKIKNNITTEDIIFPSPNQLGMFLFYGGQNTWAELKNENGKSLDELSRID